MLLIIYFLGLYSLQPVCGLSDAIFFIIFFMIPTWKSLECAQSVEYPDENELGKALSRLATLPPLVAASEIDSLRNQLAQVAARKRFLLCGGDCAELFADCASTCIDAKLRLIIQMSLVLVWAARVPVVRVMRMAGQYAKPRSAQTENVGGVIYPTFRGDIINGSALSQRVPDPSRLLQAYFHSSATLNYIRSLLSSSFADLHNAESWSLDHVVDLGVKEKYKSSVNSIMDALNFMKVIGGDAELESTKNIEVFMSHEGLLLNYEQAFTRYVNQENGAENESAVKSGSGLYNLGTHYLWIGDRTRQLAGAHVEYFRGIRNPIGVKVGPSMKPEELGPLLDIIDPYFEDGKVTLITRYGAENVAKHLKLHIEAVEKTKHCVVWCCDPMHGNTITTKTGIKTRIFANILSELTQTLQTHKDNNSWCGGVHLELTGDNVTETMGGSMCLSELDLEKNYTSHCDPRLNPEQALDVAFKIADFFNGI